LVAGLRVLLAGSSSCPFNVVSLLARLEPIFPPINVPGLKLGLVGGEFNLELGGEANRASLFGEAAEGEEFLLVGEVFPG
jgi:hypothetical protein